MAVPGRIGQGEIEQGCKALGDIEPSVVERGERADGAAELEHQSLAAQPSQPLARARQCRSIAGKLEAERHGQRHAASRSRPTVAVRRWRPTSAVKPSTARSRSLIRASIAALRSSTSAVSMTSWLVAPQCT